MRKSIQKSLREKIIFSQYKLKLPDGEIIRKFKLLPKKILWGWSCLHG